MKYTNVSTTFGNKEGAPVRIPVETTGRGTRRSSEVSGGKGEISQWLKQTSTSLKQEEVSASAAYNEARKVIQTSVQPGVLRQTGDVLVLQEREEAAGVDLINARLGLKAFADQAKTAEEFLRPYIWQENDRAVVFKGETIKPQPGQKRPDFILKEQQALEVDVRDYIQTAKATKNIDEPREAMEANKKLRDGRMLADAKEAVEKMKLDGLAGAIVDLSIEKAPEILEYQQLLNERRELISAGEDPEAIAKKELQLRIVSTKMGFPVLVVSDIVQDEVNRHQAVWQKYDKNKETNALTALGELTKAKDFSHVAYYAESENRSQIEQQQQEWLRIGMTPELALVLGIENASLPPEAAEAQGIQMQLLKEIGVDFGETSMTAARPVESAPMTIGSVSQAQAVETPAEARPAGTVSAQVRETLDFLNSI